MLNEIRARAITAINKNYMKFDSEDVQFIKKCIDKMYDYSLTKDELVDLYDIISYKIDNFSVSKREVILRILRVAFRDGMSVINDKKSWWTLETFAWGLEE